MSKGRKLSNGFSTAGGDVHFKIHAQAIIARPPWPFNRSEACHTCPVFCVKNWTSIFVLSIF